MSRYRGEENGGRRPARGRRKPPPDATGEERRFFDRQLRSGCRVGVRLVDGTRKEGVLGSFDDATIELVHDEEPPVVYQKSSIRYIEEL